MRSVEQHLEAVLADVSPLESLEVGLLGAVGCVLAEQVTTEHDGKEHVLLPQGTAIGARHVALLAAANLGRIWVHPKPRVVILTVGSDLADPGTLEDLLKSSGIKGKLSDISATDEKAISGKYKAKLLTLTTAIADCKTGATCFILNTFTEKGTLKTKDLAPEKLNLTIASGYTDIAKFDKAVYAGIDNLKVGADIKTVLTELYRSIVDNKTNYGIIPQDEIDANDNIDDSVNANR